VRTRSTGKVTIESVGCLGEPPWPALAYRNARNGKRYIWLAPRHSNAIQVNSPPLSSKIRIDDSPVCFTTVQFPGKLVLIGNDVHGGVAWRQDSDSGSGGYGLCHAMAQDAPSLGLSGANGISKEC
jgi:hypothetical protein